MKKIILIFIVLASIQTQAQENWGIDLGYKVQLDRFNHAYSIQNADGTVSIESDAFMAHNFFIDVISWNEEILWSANTEGFIYFIFLNLQNNPNGGLTKNQFFNWDKVKSDNPHIANSNREASESVHPDHGAGDYQFFDADWSFGNSKIKGGLNFAGGFLGANDKGNGIRLGPSSLSNDGAQTPNIGYLQYGVIGHYLLNESKVNQLVSLSLSRMSTFSKFEKRKGYAVELEFKYFFGADGNDWRPYVTGLFEFRKLEAGESGAPNTVGNPHQIPALKTVAIGFKVGILLGNVL